MLVFRPVINKLVNLDNFVNPFYQDILKKVGTLPPPTRKIFHEVSQAKGIKYLILLCNVFFSSLNTVPDKYPILLEKRIFDPAKGKTVVL